MNLNSYIIICSPWERYRNLTKCGSTYQAMVRLRDLSLIWLSVGREYFFDPGAIITIFSHFIIIFLIFNVNIRRHPTETMVQGLPFTDTALWGFLLTSCNWRCSSLLFWSISPARPHRRSDELTSSFNRRIDRAGLRYNVASSNFVDRRWFNLLAAISFMAEDTVSHHRCRHSRFNYDIIGIANYYWRRSDSRSAPCSFHCLVMYFHLSLLERFF